ncbi:uncharacterized protein LOC112347022 [Selaginella moellendorffii]|uniref:uncharacterized protein LOC112347022 n=1 Tax=Selaginella moellendorffii TaxID=88036 RepID=UPI000D1C9996|nr:uncharacterized protein LOC112347022 [Selaginella moellendorffii]|eukprot:XP_024532883.1 uncharacterized protein LOC112347022 [Selaginella moellendorffii]
MAMAAMRRALSRGIIRRRCCGALQSVQCGASGDRFFSRPAFGGTDSPLIRDQPGSYSLFFARGFAKKSAKAKKAARAQEEEEDEEEEEEEIDLDVEEPKRGAKEHMDAAMDALATELGKLRTGRATPGMLDHVEVEIDEKPVALSHVAAVSVVNSQTLSVMPFDTSTVKKVEAAIRLSPLGLNPIAAEQIISVPIPKLTKELSDSMCKLASKAGEDTKKSIRRGRQTAMDQLKKMSSSLSKDELKRHEKEVDELTKQFVKAVDDVCKKKEAEISKGV